MRLLGSSVTARPRRVQCDGVKAARLQLRLLLAPLGDARAQLRRRRLGRQQARRDAGGDRVTAGGARPAGDAEGGEPARRVEAHARGAQLRVNRADLLGQLEHLPNKESRRMRTGAPGLELSQGTR